MKSKKNAKILLTFGILLVIISPFLFTRSFGLISFENTGQIGDTIGGITAPIVNLIGAVLVYFALDAQIRANEIIQQQINEQKTDDNYRKELNYVNDLYKHFKNGTDNFQYQKEKQLGSFENKRKVIVEYKGTVAISKFLDDLEYYTDDPHDDKIFYSKPELAEFISIIEIGVLLVNRIDQSNIKDSDKNYFMTLMIQYLEYKIWPGFSDKQDKIQKTEPCKHCGNIHSGFPLKLYSTVLEFKEIIEKTAENNVYN